MGCWNGSSGPLSNTSDDPRTDRSSLLSDHQTVSRRCTVYFGELTSGTKDTGNVEDESN
jgi:hypothetical protein